MVKDSIVSRPSKSKIHKIEFMRTKIKHVVFHNRDSRKG